MLFRRFISASWVVGRGLALLVVLSLALPGWARAQAAAGARVLVGRLPAPGTTASHIFIHDGPYKGPAPVYYVDGRRLDSTAVDNKIHPDNMERVSILKDFDARKLGPDEARLGVVIIVTKAGQHKRAVRAFNRRLERLSHHKP